MPKQENVKPGLNKEADILETNKNIPKIDKRTKNGKKLDIAQVIKLKDINRLSFQDIANKTGYSKPYVHTAYTEFKKLLPSIPELETFKNNRANLLSGIEYKMLQNIADDDKISKASLNNVAYSFNQIHTARRLEEGKGTAGGVTVNIEIAYQEATDRSRNIRLKHIGSNEPIVIDNDLQE